MAITMAITIVVTASTSLAIALIFFYIYHNLYLARRRKKDFANTSFRREEISVTCEEFKKCGRNMKGLVTVSDNEMDSNFYLRKLEAGQLKTNFQKVVSNPSFEEEEDDEKEDTEKEEEEVKRVKNNTKEEKQRTCKQPQQVMSTLKLASRRSNLVKNQALLVSSASSSPCPTIRIPTRPPPPPPPPPLPPPSPLQGKAANSDPEHRETLPRAGSWPVSFMKPPRTSSNGRERSNSKTETPSKKILKDTDGGSPMKLKPLHWDKVKADVDHSLIWHEINDGSFRFDDELMETLFGYGNTNHHQTFGRNILSSASSCNLLKRTQSLILEPRKSMNASIILRSLEISCKDILEALLGGQELNIDTLEKLTKIAPTKEETTKILQLNNNTLNNLPYAESYLYNILKVVPSAFTRINAMLFKANYHSDILHLKQSIQVLELGCKELRARGLFMILLEAILKAGNKLNAGTPRGNAQGFNLSALLKLSDIKSTDGNTSLLHFVVEQVARSEARHCENNTRAHCDQEKEYINHGLSILESLNKELTNVKKAAAIEYVSFNNMCSKLNTCAVEIQHQLLSMLEDDNVIVERDGFVKEMKRFLEECEKEIKLVSEEQRKVMELVKRTTEYYQAGAAKDKGWEPFQIFFIVKDFVEMVDQVRVEIIRKLQKRSVMGSGNFGSSPPLSPTTIVSPSRFQNFHSNFVSDMSLSSSESD